MRNGSSEVGSKPGSRPSCLVLWLFVDLLHDDADCRVAKAKELRQLLEHAFVRTSRFMDPQVARSLVLHVREKHLQ